MFTANSTFREIISHESIKPFAPYLLYKGEEMYAERLDKTVEEMHPGAECSSMLHGLNRVLTLAQKGNFYFPVYKEEECTEDPQKKDVNVLYFPAEKKDDRERPFILICPGGAYMNVWSFTEGYTAAARYNEYGYDAFILTYRTGGPALFPKPMEDVANALRFIKANEKKFQVKGGRYIVCGFSAGGNLTCQWGTRQNGYGAYGLPKPEALFPIYPVVSFVDFRSDELFEMMATLTQGEGTTKEQAMKYEVLTLIDGDYPPVYDAFCMDDELVPAQNSLSLKAKLEEYKVPCRFMIGNTGGHGFSEGLHTDCAGWVKDSVEFYEGL